MLRGSFSFAANAALLLIALAIAVPGGAWSARLVLDRMAESRSAASWTPLPGTGVHEPDPYEAALLALDGRLPLGRAEGLTFSANRDDEGALLRRECAYTIAGPVPPARFWTLRAASSDLRILPPLGSRPAALHAFEALRSADGTIAVSTGPRPAAGNWLAVGGTGTYTLVLTFYDPASSGSFSSDAVALPAIRRLPCDV